MSEFGKIIENLALAKMLEKRVETKQLSHAYLFVSGDELFLGEFCDWFASKILNDEVKVKSLTHPDYFKINQQKNITVEQIEPIVSDVYVSPLQAEQKVYVIFDANCLTQEAQNKLLKTIEEPPKNVVLILAAKAVGAMLPTVLSRVARFDIDPLTEGQIKKLLIGHGVEENKANIISTCANGNFSHALNLSSNEDFFATYNLAVKLVGEINSSKDIMPFASKIDLSKISLFEFIDLTISLVRDIMVIIAGKNELVTNKLIIVDLIKFSNQYNLISVEKILKMLNNARKNLFFNSNAQMVLDELLLDFVEVKVRCKKLLA